MIEKGASIRKGQDILQIVDLSELVVALKIHESRILQVRKGAPVSVKLASLPGRTIRGEVSYVSRVASAALRFGSGKKVYKTQVRLLNPPAHVRPGQSVMAEIFISSLTRPGSSSRPGIDRPGTSRPRPSGGGTRPSGGGGNSADAFKAPTELKLTSEQQQKWEGVAEFSKAAFDAAMEQRNFQELRTIREDFKKQIKGILTAEQMAQYEKLQPQRGGGGGGRPSGGSRRGLMDYDEDKDGKVSESEYGKMSERARQFMGEFSALDSNGDGGITKDEADAARQRMMQRFQQGGGGGRGGSPTPPKENPEK
jgi:hypothetical protein